MLILLGVELLLAIALGQSAHVDRSAMARAWMQWRQNPTTEAHQEFTRQQGITEISAGLLLAWRSRCLQAAPCWLIESVETNFPNRVTTQVAPRLERFAVRPSIYVIALRFWYAKQAYSLQRFGGRPRPALRASLV